MAKYQMCSVLDMVAQQYGRPFFTVSDGTAIRSFADEILKGGPDSTLSTHPDDFQLFLIGTFSDDSCEIDLLPSPRLLVSGAAIAHQTGRNGVANSPEPAVGAIVGDMPGDFPDRLAEIRQQVVAGKRGGRSHG